MCACARTRPPARDSPATTPGGIKSRASQCGASLSALSLPEIQAKEACSPIVTNVRQGVGLNLHDPLIPDVGVGSLKSLGKTGWEELGGEAGQKCVFGYHKDERVGLAGPEGALFPSVGAPAGSQTRSLPSIH